MNLLANLKNEDLAAASDQLACEFYHRKLWKESIKQNEVTLSLLGERNPLVLKNIAQAYYELTEVDKSLELMREYMNITKSTNNSDIRGLAQYMTRAGHFDEAKEIVFNQSECTNKHLDMGWFLHRDGQFKEAFIETEIGRNGAFWTGKKYPPQCSRWEGITSIKGTKLLVIGEAGMGDEIIFSRWIPKLKEMGATVYYWSDTSLQNVITRNFSVFPYDHSIRYDYWIPAMSLPYALKEDKPGDAAYLKPNPLYVAKWKDRIPSDAIILNWTGDQGHMENKFREIPIDYLVPKIKHLGTLMSVCMDATHCPEGVIDLTKDIKDWDDTLAILSLSKMCFTMSSSVSVAAGALGVPTHLYDIVVGYFTWCAIPDGEKTNWFPDVRVWRQSKFGEWISVIDKSINYVLNDPR